MGKATELNVNSPIEDLRNIKEAFIQGSCKNIKYLNVFWKGMKRKTRYNLVRPI